MNSNTAFLPDLLANPDMILRTMIDLPTLLYLNLYVFLLYSIPSVYILSPRKYTYA